MPVHLCRACVDLRLLMNMRDGSTLQLRKVTFISMKKYALVDTLVYGLVIWLVGFVLGMVLFPFVEISVMGWILMPVTLIVALFLSMRIRRKRSAAAVSTFIGVGLSWVALSLILDYAILVKGYSAENFYDVDIIIYYIGVLLIPIIVSLLPRKQ